MLGIIIGVTSVILLVSIGNGLKFYIKDQFESLGANKLYVMPGQALKSSYRGPNASGSIKFNFDDVKRLERVAGVTTVAPMTELSKIISYRDNNMFTTIIGGTVEAKIAQNVAVAQGRFFNKAEEERGAKVAVIGDKVREDLFKSEEGVGKKFSLDNKKFTVVGVMEKKGGVAGLGDSIDNQLLVPYKAVFEITGEREFPFLMIVAENESVVNDVKERAKKVLVKYYKEEDFTIADQSEILSVVGSILGVLTLGLSGIAAISLIVGGVGIMNIMFVSVTERIKEIGLRKAVGATSAEILYQFLLESIVLALTGGIIGVLAGYGLAVIINKFFPASVTWWSVLLSSGVSALIGIVFGVAPARRASRLSSIEALRYE